MTEEERAARGWPSTARVPLVCRTAAQGGATGALAGFPASPTPDTPKPLSGPLSASQGEEVGTKNAEGPL